MDFESLMLALGRPLAGQGAPGSERFHVAAARPGHRGGGQGQPHQRFQVDFRHLLTIVLFLDIVDATGTWKWQTLSDEHGVYADFAAGENELPLAPALDQKLNRCFLSNARCLPPFEPAKHDVS